MIFDFRMVDFQGGFNGYRKIGKSYRTINA